MLRSPREANLKNVEKDQDISQVDPWVTIHRTIRDREEDKVQDCKEDMDTLLVFAGLYSAVLTSFVVQSYQSLQEDPQQTSVVLLRQITSQTSSYTLSNGSLNSTAPPLPPSSPFEAASPDVIVNICWFASLVLSLSTASFGILVKQWLREYLAIDRTVPEERIRILHFRARGVEEWKLFEIAAILPLVLQLSLALFFVGLCYFTSEIHPSLRATSLTLVGGWAFLFGLAVLAPLVSARCPYKTTFLKAVFRRIRTCVRDLWRKLWRKPAATSIRHLSLQLYIGMKQSYSNMRKLCDTFARLIRTRDNEAHGPAGIEVRRYENDNVLRLDDSASDRDPPDVIMDALRNWTLDEDATVPEEEKARTSARHDLRIFREVDSVLRDDHLLAAMRLVLQRRRQDAESMLRFVVSTLHGRLGFRTLDLADCAAVLNKVTELSPSTCLAFMNILSDALQHDSICFFSEQIISLMFLLGREGHSYLEDMTPIFHQILSNGRSLPLGWEARVIQNGSAEAWQNHVFSTLADAFKTLDPSVLRSVVHHAYVQSDEEPGFESNTYSRLLEYAMPPRASDTELRRRVPPRVLGTLFGLVSSILRGMTDEVAGSKPLDAARNAHFKELLRFFFDVIPMMKQVQDIFWAGRFFQQIVDLMRSLFMTPALISTVLECLGAHGRVFTPEASWLVLQDLARYVSTCLSARDRANVLAELANYLRARLHSQSPLTTYEILLYSGCVTFPTSSDEHHTQLKQIFSLTTESLRKASRLPPVVPSFPTDTESRASQWTSLIYKQRAVSGLAHMSLQYIDRHSEDGTPLALRSAVGYIGQYNGANPKKVEKENAQYYGWRELFDVGESVYPDELIVLLRKLTHDRTDLFGRTFWRVRRLEDMKRGDYVLHLGTAQDSSPSGCSATSGLGGHGAGAGSDLEVPQALYGRDEDPADKAPRQQSGPPGSSETPAAVLSTSRQE